jgi:hypothetical protein
MRLNFCTLFDSYYLSRGIALYNSLELYCGDFHLYIFAFDDKSFTELRNLNFTRATIISLRDFESEDLLRVKSSRTVAEYCWTCTASTLWYSIKNYELDHCTYLDADMLFFSSPIQIFNEIGGKSIGITPHNFSANYKTSEVYGKYCVQFIFIKNDSFGMEALNWWRKSCIEWCYAKLEDGKYGDQKYLDYFEDRFTNVCVIKEIGCGVAPWNITDYEVKLVDEKLMVALKRKPKESRELIFYHFQGLKFNDNLELKEVLVTPAIGFVQKKALEYIYKPYIISLIEIKAKLQQVIYINKSIIFRNMVFKMMGLVIRNMFRRYKFVQFIFYNYIKKRYNRPSNLGGVVK